MGIRAKQVDTGTFGATTVGRAPFGANLFDATLSGSVFAAAAIPTAKLAEGADFLQRDGSVVPTANLPMGSFKLTGLADGTGANDAVNKGQLDSAITGLQWIDPVTCIDLVGNLGEVALEALTPAASDSYVVSAVDGDGSLVPGALAIAVGDVVEYTGTVWVKVLSNAGGFPPAGSRFILNDTVTALIAPYTSSQDEGKVADFDGASLTASLTTPLDGWAVLVKGSVGDTAPVDDNNGYVFDGVVPTGTWVQFTGAGQINAGQGLTKAGNTLNVGDVNKGIQANADDLQLDASEVAGNGLGQRAGGGNEHLLDVVPDTVATDDSAAVVAGANGLSIDGDLVSVDQVPTNYTRSAAGTGVDVKDLASHLLGIDNALATAGGTPNQETVTTQNITGTDTALTDTLNNTPTSNAALTLFLNGILLLQGAGNDYSVSGQVITWLANTGTAPDLDTGDELIAVYEV